MNPYLLLPLANADSSRSLFCPFLVIFFISELPLISMRAPIFLRAQRCKYPLLAETSKFVRKTTEWRKLCLYFKFTFNIQNCKLLPDPTKKFEPQKIPIFFMFIWWNTKSILNAHSCVFLLSVLLVLPHSCIQVTSTKYPIKETTSLNLLVPELFFNFSTPCI